MALDRYLLEIAILDFNSKYLLPRQKVLPQHCLQSCHRKQRCQLFFFLAYTLHQLLPFCYNLFHPEKRTELDL